MRLNLPNYLRLRRSPVISEFYFLSRRNISNKLSVEFAPGRIIRWRKRRFVLVDCTGFEAIIAREVGKRRLERITVAEAQPDHSINQRAISVTISWPSRRTSGKQLSGNS